MFPHELWPKYGDIFGLELIAMPGVTSGRMPSGLTALGWHRAGGRTANIRHQRRCKEARGNKPSSASAVQALARGGGTVTEGAQQPNCLEQVECLREALRARSLARPSHHVIVRHASCRKFWKPAGALWMCCPPVRLRSSTTPCTAVPKHQRRRQPASA